MPTVSTWNVRKKIISFRVKILKEINLCTKAIVTPLVPEALSPSLYIKSLYTQEEFLIDI
ncbi:hypothetical protein BpHYR1_022161 [Brachionus plicatilis]|uniref:Uncharacterized protein n=1 Tax=Brachionus plicatilis TaxID=10195 RepID=A0A3M7SKM9_BRAPC|nr:hypothetical protein BpHYR1_022161 [Brachionus plicatilis]